MSVLATLLGGNSSSRIFNEVREKRGLAYYAYASADTFQDMGSLYALEGVALDKVEEAIKVTRGEFGKVAEGKGVSSEEVERAKEYVVGKMTLDLEDSSVMANLMVRKLLLENEVETVAEVVEKIRKVSAGQVKRLAKRVFDKDKVNLAVVGPYEDEERFGKLVGSRQGFRIL